MAGGRVGLEQAADSVWHTDAVKRVADFRTTSVGVCLQSCPAATSCCQWWWGQVSFLRLPLQYPCEV